MAYETIPFPNLPRKSNDQVIVCTMTVAAAIIYKILPPVFA